MPLDESRDLNKERSWQWGEAWCIYAGYKSREAYPSGNHNRV